MYDKQNLKKNIYKPFSRKFAANDFNVLKTYTDLYNKYVRQVDEKAVLASFLPSGL